MSNKLISPNVLVLGMLLWTTPRLTAQQVPILFPDPLSPRIANYNMDVRLDTKTRTLEGQELLVWHNKSSDTITELQFHMYLNAFRNSESTFMRGSRGISRGNRLGKDGWGFSDIDRISVAYGRDLKGSIQYVHPTDAPEVMAGSVDLTERIEYFQPDDGNEYDKTVFRLPLPRPLPPGESVVVNIDFTAKLPTPPFARTGAKKEYFFVGQWFPKIAVYTDQGWNCHQFHPNSEFFADFGVYNVRITVPEQNIVGATGVEVEVRNNGDGTATHFYHAEDVHDFAWTTSPEFRVFTDQAQDVNIRVLMQPDHAYQGQRHLDAAKVAVEHFQNWYGDYPFPNLTVVDPRRGAGGSGGMEYPTLITAGTAYGLPKGLHMVEAVIIHEFGHNFWYHLLASNEFEEAWMDEGINSYTDTQIMNDAYGPTGDMVDFLGIKLNDIQRHHGSYLFNADLDPIITRAWDFYSGGSYGVNSYSKPALVLNTLRNYIGADLMREVMRTYVQRWRFKHPKSEDFFDVVEDVTGKQLDWFFDQAFRTNAVLDYSVASVSTREIKAAKGFDFGLSTTEDDSAMTDSELESSNGEPASSGKAESDSAAAKEKAKMYATQVKVRRLGDFRFPVEVEFVFEDGESVRENWNGQGYWKKFEFEKPAKLLYATVDPDRKILLDICFANNSRTVKKQRLGVNKLSARWMFWLQSLLDQPDLLNLLSIAGVM